MPLVVRCCADCGLVNVLHCRRMTEPDCSYVRVRNVDVPRGSLQTHATVTSGSGRAGGRGAESDTLSPRVNTPSGAGWPPDTSSRTPTGSWESPTTGAVGGAGGDAGGGRTAPR